MKRKKKTGNSPVLLFLGLFVALCLGTPAFAGPKSKKPPPYAVIVGSVFRDNGFSLPGAEATVGLASGEGKKLAAESDEQGEFAIRVPPVPASYVVSVKHTGYVTQQKTVTVEGEGPVNITFQLDPAKEKSK